MLIRCPVCERSAIQKLLRLSLESSLRNSTLGLDGHLPRSYLRAGSGINGVDISSQVLIYEHSSLWFARIVTIMNRCLFVVVYCNGILQNSSKTQDSAPPRVWAGFPRIRLFWNNILYVCVWGKTTVLRLVDASSFKFWKLFYGWTAFSRWRWWLYFTCT